jgi:hypothetical protein
MSNFVILAGATLAALLAGTVTLAASPPGSAGSAAEATAKALPALTERAGQLARLIDGETVAEKVFAPAFLAQVPADRLARIAATVRARHGPAMGVARIEADTANSGTIYIGFENSQVPVRLLLADQAPHFVMGLQF